MNDRIEISPDSEQRRRIMDFIMAAGQTLLENGAEVFRVEQTMEIMARSFHLREFHVYVLTNGIFASAGTAEISEIRNVPNRTIHLGRVDAVNTLSREIASGQLSLDEAESRLVQARRIPFPKDRMQLLAGTVGSFCFSLMFGGTLFSALVSALAGLAASAYLLLCEQHSIPGGFQKISTAALITMVSIVGCLPFGPKASVSHAVIGALMILTPGVAFTMGLRDFVHGDYLSGTIRMIDALLIAASIAVGTGLVLGLYGWITGVTVI
ncbi:MAG: threonine/serine exporter ThrE family protein [Faecalibacterium sp.]